MGKISRTAGACCYCDSAISEFKIIIITFSDGAQLKLPICETHSQSFRPARSLPTVLLSTNDRLQIDRRPSDAARQTHLQNRPNHPVVPGLPRQRVCPRNLPSRQFTRLGLLARPNADGQTNQRHAENSPNLDSEEDPKS